LGGERGGGGGGGGVGGGVGGGEYALCRRSLGLGVHKNFK